MFSLLALNDDSKLFDYIPWILGILVAFYAIAVIINIITKKPLVKKCRTTKQKKRRLLFLCVSWLIFMLLMAFIIFDNWNFSGDRIKSFVGLGIIAALTLLKASCYIRLME